MEIVAWLAGERHNDGPQCTSPVIAAFVRGFNDVIPNDAGRSYYLRRWIPRLVNTAGSEEVEARRALLVIDFMVRILLPMHLLQEGDARAARELAGLRPIDSPIRTILAGLAVKQECHHPLGAVICSAIKFAGRECVPGLWVPTAAGLIQKNGTPAAFDQGVRLLSRLVRAAELVKRPRPRDRRTAPPSA